MSGKSIFEKRARTNYSEGLMDTPMVTCDDEKQDNREYVNEVRETMIHEREAAALSLNEAIQCFKNESDEQCAINEHIIAAFRIKIPFANKDLIQKYNARMDELEIKNNYIMCKMHTFIFEGKAKWISFKNEHKHDMGCLKKALRDFEIERC